MLKFSPKVKEIFRKNELIIVKAKQSFCPFLKWAKEIFFLLQNFRILKRRQ